MVLPLSKTPIVTARQSDPPVTISTFVLIVGFQHKRPGKLISTRASKASDVIIECAQWQLTVGTKAIPALAQ
jgi:hypothetical protein